MTEYNGYLVFAQDARVKVQTHCKRVCYFFFFFFVSVYFLYFFFPLVHLYILEVISVHVDFLWVYPLHTVKLIYPIKYVFCIHTDRAILRVNSVCS